MHVHSHEFTLGLAFLLGALHAIEPGHGKTAMLVYLAGGRRSFWHPIVMGLSSGLAHTVSLGIIALAVHLTHHLVSGDHAHENEYVTDMLRWFSAILILGVGGWMWWSADRQRPITCGCKQHQHAACEDKKKGERATSYSMSALLGVAFGLLPCPSALAAYFASMSAGNLLSAYAAIGLFATGIACSLALIGIALQHAGTKWLQRPNRFSKLPWPHIRAAIVLSIGIFYLVRMQQLHP
jgi:nickel/cobalt transporter (NicO) family protein